MNVPIFTVDAFTDRPFAGNPAGVCLLRDWKPESWLQAVAQEMNLSETAFLVPATNGFHLRWFTPQVEVDLCGHATLASAHVLWEDGVTPSDRELNFTTKSGVLRANKVASGIELDFPSKPQQAAPAPAGLLEALGVEAVHVGRNQFDYLVELASEAEVRDLKPDFSRLRAVEARGVIVTCISHDPRFDFFSRFFAPAVGIDEDPVTGSAHCCLAPYWHKKLGKKEMVGFQASRRGGVVRVRVSDDGNRVFLGGRAVTVVRGKLDA